MESSNVKTIFWQFEYRTVQVTQGNDQNMESEMLQLQHIQEVNLELHFRLVEALADFKL